MTDLVALTAGAVIYVAAAAWAVFRVVRDSDEETRGPELSLAFGIGLLIIFLLWRGIRIAAFPATGLGESLALLSLGVGIGYLVMIRVVERRGMAVILLPIAAGLVAGSALSSAFMQPQENQFSSIFLALHATSLFASYAALVVGSGASIAYLVQERALKRKAFGGLSRHLPPLATLDSLSYRAITLGFPMLTFGLVVGSVWASMEWGSYWFWEPKLTLSLLLWLLGAAVFHLRTIEKRQGRRTALLTIVSCVMVIVVFIVPMLISGGRHAFL